MREWASLIRVAHSLKCLPAPLKSGGGQSSMAPGSVLKNREFPVWLLLCRWVALPATCRSAPSPAGVTSSLTLNRAGSARAASRRQRLQQGSFARHEAARRFHSISASCRVVILILPDRVPQDHDTSAWLLHSEALPASSGTSFPGPRCCRERAPSGGGGRHPRG
jgi:hypothetical protein